MKLILPGRIVPAQAPDDPQLAQFVTVRPIQTQELEGATRAGRVIEEHELTGAADDDIVEIEYKVESRNGSRSASSKRICANFLASAVRPTMRCGCRHTPSTVQPNEVSSARR